MNKIYQKSPGGNKTAGFTLIELLVVVLIIGILAAIALPQYEKAVEKSRAAEAVSWLKILRDQQAVCIMEHGGYEPVCGQPDEPGEPSLFNSSGITLPGSLDNDCGYYSGCISTKYFTYYVDGQYITAERNPFENSKYMLETTALSGSPYSYNRISCGSEDGWCQKAGFIKEENGSWYQP